MTAPTPQPRDDHSEALTADLVELYGHTPAIPPMVDARIRAESRRHFTRMARSRVLLRWGGGAAAAAAILLVTLRLLPSNPPPFHPQGRLTILDAFSLARQLKSGGRIDKSWDVNGDGSIDEKDVDALAARAVSMSDATKGAVQ